MLESTHKPFSQACENNYPAIIPHLKVYLADCHTLLEIGSGTGQHAYYFANELSHLTWPLLINI